MIALAKMSLVWAYGSQDTRQVLLVLTLGSHLGTGMTKGPPPRQ